MNEIVIIGSIENISLKNLQEILEINLTEGIFNFIENGNVLLYESNSIEICAEPEKKGDTQKEEAINIHLTGRHYGTLKSFEPFINSLGNSLREKNISYTIDYQLEDSEGIPISDERRISFVSL